MKAIILCLFLAGCAATPERWLSAEEDAALKERCQATGCTMVPNPIWERIQAIMQAIIRRNSI